MNPAERWAKLPSHPTIRHPLAEVHARIAEFLADGWRPDLTVVPPLWRRKNGETLVMYRVHEKAIRAGHGDDRPDDKLTSLVEGPEAGCRWPTDGTTPGPGIEWDECGLPAVLDVSNGPAVHWLARLAVCELHRHDAYRAGWHAVVQAEPELEQAGLAQQIQALAEQIISEALLWPAEATIVMHQAAVVLRGGNLPEGVTMRHLADALTELAAAVDAVHALAAGDPPGPVERVRRGALRRVAGIAWAVDSWAMRALARTEGREGT